jgi:hypothetical protein
MEAHLCKGRKKWGTRTDVGYNAATFPSYPRMGLFPPKELAMRQTISPLLLSFVVTICLCTQYSIAQDPPPGAASWSLILGGRTVTCSSAGHPVRWVADYSLNDAGHTMPGFGTILYNPHILDTFSDALKLWGMGHECGHAFNRTANENEADCWSITMGIRQGWFGPDDVDDLVQLFHNNAGDLNHPPGTTRIANMKKCMNREVARESKDSAPPSEDHSQEQSHESESPAQPVTTQHGPLSEDDGAMGAIGVGSMIVVGDTAVTVPANTELVYFQDGTIVGGWGDVDRKRPSCRLNINIKPETRILGKGRKLVVTSAEFGDTPDSYGTALVFKGDPTVYKLQCSRGTKGAMTIGELKAVMGGLFTLVPAAPISGE